MRTKRKFRFNWRRKLAHSNRNHLLLASCHSHRSSNLLILLSVIVIAAASERYAPPDEANHPLAAAVATGNQSSYLSSDYAVGPSLAGDELDEPADSVERAIWRRQVDLADSYAPAASLPVSAAGFGRSEQFAAEPLLSAGPNSAFAGFPDYDAYRPAPPDPFGGDLQAEQVGSSSYLRRALPSGLESAGGAKSLISQTTSATEQQQQQQQQQAKMGPQFIKEPPSYISYLNSTDLVIPCSASGNPAPAISWWHKSSQLEIGSLLDRRYVRYDNSLVISAFKPQDYEPDIHSTVYKCQASNSLGAIVSRDVVISAVIDPELEVSVADQFVSVDNDAVFRCQLGAQTRHLFQVIGWLEDGQSLGVQPSAPLGQTSWLGGARAQQQQQQQPIGSSQQRALLLPDGQLYIQRVQLKDANKSYRCQIKNLLSSAVSVSALSGRLFVTDASEQGGAAPRIVDAPKPITPVRLADQLLLTCLAQGFPRPHLRWFRQVAEPNGQRQQQPANGDGWIELGPTATGSPQQANESARFLVSQEANLLLIKSVLATDNRAKFRCLANNSYGIHQADTELRVELWPANKQVELEPRAEYINNADFQRQSVLFNCTIRSGIAPVLAIEWLKNGRPLFALALSQYASSQAQPQSPAPGSPGHWLSGYAEPLFTGHNSSASSALGLFEEPNQELSAIEYYLPSPGSASGDQLAAANGALDGSSSTNSLNGDTGLSNPDGFGGVSQPFDWLASAIGSNPLDRTVQQQQLAGQYLVSSSSLAKLSSESDSSPSQLFGTGNGGNLAPHTTGRRLRQRVRLISRDSILYQLQIDQVRRSDRGAYQCRARSTKTILHAAANLMLKDNPPQFVDTFVSQLLAGSGSIGAQELKTAQGSQSAAQVSLRCVASGSPLPEISWTLSGFPVPELSRFRVGDYVTRDGLIVSFVNISNVQAEDGGLYECSATNDVGQLRHSGWLNVTGPPYVRPMPNVNAIAGRSMSIMCPVGGHPIEQISWFQNSSKLPVNHRQKLFSNGSLLISDLNEVSDVGQYWCQAKSANSDLVALNHVHLSIKVPPVVEPFSFAKSLHRGQRYNIMCTVVRGDLPVSIRWLKDGRLLEQPQQQAAASGSTGPLLFAENGADSGSNQLNAQASPISSSATTLNEATGIAIKHLDPYSSTLTFSSLQAHHRGLYSCEAANEAGRANQSSTLVIHVPPEWRMEPHDLSVTVGKTAVIDCQADGTPPARIEWRLSQDLFREPPSEFKPIISSLYMRVFENGSLIIYNTQRTDAGYYLCQASNGVGPGLSRVIKLTVHVAAHFKTKIRTELVRRGQAARLRCEAIGDLPIEINWLKDKMPLYGNEEPRYTLSRVNLQDGLVSELHLLETERSDSALFTCITQNQFGNDDTNIQLIVQAPPDPPLDIRIQEYEARSAKLSWLAGFSGNAPISKYVIMYAQTSELPSPMSANGNQLQHYVNVSVPGNESSLILQALTPLTEYQFYIMAINSIGSSRLANEPIKFRTDDETPAGPPMFVKATGASSRSIKVRWRTPERRVHYGSISGFYVGYRLHRGATGLQSASQPSQVALTGGGQVTEQTRDTFIYKTVELAAGSDLASLSNRTFGLQGVLEQECTLTGLRRGQKYLITVQAFNGRGAGPASEPVLAETWRIDVPEPPSLRMVLRTTHSIHLAWRPSGQVPATINSSDQGANGPTTPAASNQQRVHPIQQAALMMRKTISDHVKSHSAPMFTTSISAGLSNDIDLSEPIGEQVKQPRRNLPISSDDNGNDNDLLAAQANEPILGFVLTRRQLQPANGEQVAQGQVALLDQVETRLPSDHLSQIIDNLQCGTRYQFNIAAINSVGVSAPSDPLIVKTEGSAPVAPDKSSLLAINASTSVLINLSAWHNGACAIQSFEVMFKQSRSKKWTPLASYQVQQQQQQAAGAGGDQTGSQPAEFRSSANSQVRQSDQSAASSSQMLVPQSLSGGSSSTKHVNGSTIVLDDLSATLNYDIKIVATNEAGSTEAVYTFSTGAGNGALSRAEQEWSSTGGEFQFGDVHLSDLLFSNGQMLPWLLMLLVGSLTLSMGCIVAARRRHAASSTCSLSLSSASRSNQSSSNYYTADANGHHHHHHQLDPARATAGKLAPNRCQPTNLADSMTLDSAQDSPILAGQKIIHLADIYGHQQANGHRLSLMEKSNYAYLAGNQQGRPASPHNTDITSVINGSETEMCLGASALNIHRREQEVAGLDSAQQAVNQGENDHGIGNNQAKQLQRVGQHEQLVGAEQAGFYVAPILMQAGPTKSNQQQVAPGHQLGKSSTLPANCHQQILQHLIQQQQQQQNNNNSANGQPESQANQQHVMDSLMAANMLQHCNQPDICAGQHATLLTAANGSAPTTSANMAAMLEQQLQQQVYATVKRGCPRPPRLCDYTIYQCPDQQQHQLQQQDTHQQQQLSMLRCCNELQQADQQAQVCYLPIQQACLQQQQQQRQQTSDYQQLRPIN